MGLNVYMEAAESKGYVAGATSALAAVHYIKPRTGKRPVILAFGATGGAATTGDLYFMQTLGSTSLSAAAASGATSITFAAEPASGNDVATEDFVCVGLDNGNYTFGVVTLKATLAITIDTALEGAAAAGNPVHFLGKYSDSGHLRFKLTASTQNTKDTEVGVAFGVAKGLPMIAYIPPAGSVPASIDYLTVGFINK